MKIKKLKNSEYGASLVEYALLVAIIAVPSVMMTGEKVASKFEQVGDELLGAGLLKILPYNKAKSTIAIMNKPLSWPEIEKLYNQEWVQLVDYDWPEGEPYPRSGRVRVHAESRKEFNRLITLKEGIQDAARVFVGKAMLPPHTIISCNSIKLLKCEQ